MLGTNISTFGSALLALGVYAVGKTFFWPTMLAVASDRFPRTGAVAISMMGGIGMLSAGLIGGPGLGYFKDRSAQESLQAAKIFDTAKNANPSTFLFFEPVHGVDPKKVAAVNGKLTEIVEKEKVDKQAALQKVSPEERAMVEADVQGARGMFKVDTVIPAAMAVIYLLMLLYFKAIGGYKAVHINAPDTPATE
jgi:hypothetical protein